MLAAKYEFEKLAILYQHGRLDVFLKEQGEESLLGGWLASMLPFRGTKWWGIIICGPILRHGSGF